MNKGINVTDSNISHQVQEDVSGVDSGSSINNPGSQNQIVCSTCRILLFHPIGATSVFCVVCNSVTDVPPPGDDETPRKGVRGPTFMPSIWALPEGDRIHVLFNEYGQPIDKETTSSLSHFMGSLARSGKFCPVDTPWHKVKKAKKEILLEFIKVGTEVYLKSIVNSMEIVAKARVRSLDPDELVGSEEIGPEWCEAHVLVAIKKRERLVRPYGLFITIEDALGATVAWLCPFVSVVPEDET